MTTLSPDALLDRLQWRYATKAFDPARTIDPATWRALEQSLILAPSSYGLQPWKFLVITDAATKAKLQPVSWNQAQTTQCSHLVVVTARTSLDEAFVDRYVDRIAEVRQAPRESLAGYRGMMVQAVRQTPGQHFEWNARQAYIALGFLMSAAAVLGVDACPMEGLEPAAYDRLLDLEGSGHRTVCACALGHRAAGDKYATLPKVRFDASELIRRIG